MLRVSLVGHILDEKYKIERELGKGGMGAVYLATHVGTERAVAVKVIAPEFMRRTEFVERFRREARAAGRLRHPNVVDVTDFGIAETEWGNMAYLTMEYLDGCTLGEILEEEKKLPLSWTLDILEQTCAAVEEAHHQGIIHRDLKPDNIWLEPNASGGYTVKVLDFGIAKLEEPMHRDNPGEIYAGSSIDLTLPPESDGQRVISSTSSNGDSELNENQVKNFVDQRSSPQNSNQETLILPAVENDFSESATIVQNQVSPAAENKTAILSSARRTSVDNASLTRQVQLPENARENAETKIFDSARTNNLTAENAHTTAALTQIGAVLGTPPYMSPEQCRGERLDARADIYSLGVIAYQMLSGTTPFTGSYTEVMAAHKESVPPKLENKKVSSKVKRVISSALAKEPKNRPPTALAFSSKLRAESDGIGALLQRALVIYSERLPTFLWLSFLLLLPAFVFTLLGVAIRLLSFADVISPAINTFFSVFIGLGSFFVGIFSSSLIGGVTTWVVAQMLAAPLRPINWRQALIVARDKWRSFAGTVTITTLFSFLGYAMCVIPGLILSVRYHLVAPVVMMENLRGRAALKRSTQLVKRSLGTVVGAYFLQFLMPFIVAAIIGFFVSALLKSNEIFIAKSSQGNFSITTTDENEKPNTPKVIINNAQSEIEARATKEDSANETSANTANAADAKPKRKRGLIPMLSEALFQIIWFPTLVILSSFTSIISALLYLKTRQAGGESMTGLLTQFGETDRPQKRWQLRLNQKFEQSGRHTTSRST